MGLHGRIQRNYKALVCGAYTWIAGDRVMRVKALIPSPGDENLS